jgi:hypothetical protein
MNPLTNAGDLAGLILLATAIVTTALLTCVRALARRANTRPDAQCHDPVVSHGGQQRRSGEVLRGDDQCVRKVVLPEPQGMRGR